jgi:hypothetical protein
MGSKKAESNEITTGTDPSHITTHRAATTHTGDRPSHKNNIQQAATYSASVVDSAIVF